MRTRLGAPFLPAQGRRQPGSGAAPVPRSARGVPRPTRSPAPGGQPDLNVRIDHRAGRVTVTGRLERRTAHLVHDAITVMLQSDRIRWLVDVTGLTIDQTGLRVLGGAYRRLLRCGREMTLLGVSPQLRQALRRLRLADHVLGTTADPPS